MYPINTFSSSTFSNISTNPGAPTTLFDSNTIPAGGYAMLLGVIVTNKSTTTRSINMTLQKAGSTESAYILYDVAIPSQTAFEVIDGNKFVIQRGDKLVGWGDADGTDLIDMVISQVVYTPAI